MAEKQHNFDYDLIVVGGGSGGMAAAKEAARLGASVCMFDYVKPSTQGTTWGLGGTCVNVGCVPKKLCHYTGLLGASFHDARHFGWQVPGKVEHDWPKMIDSVQNQVKQLNFGYRGGLRSAKVQYVKALASFSGPHEVSYTFKRKDVKATADKIIIAVGGRPYIPDNVPGAKEYAITSDDIFSKRTSPGKTLCVGGAYISLETAGFLTECGLDVTVAVRSILLRGFDRQCAEKIGELMESSGTQFKRTVVPIKLEKLDSGRIQVTFEHTQTKEQHTDEYDTVLYATGRYPDTASLNLDAAGVKTAPNGKFETDDQERTNIEHIYAVGDVLQGKPELTPVAIQAGEYLVRRLFGGSTKKMPWEYIPTTVFTPYEYGNVGLTEEEAVEAFGRDNVETYLSEFSTLELGAAHRRKHGVAEDDLEGDLPPMCLSKVICNKNDNERIVGFHFVGPNAGEVTQGFALALRCGATKEMMDEVVGIHPTDAESFTAMGITRASGESWVAAGGCGGGKCG